MNSRWPAVVIAVVVAIAAIAAVLISWAMEAAAQSPACKPVLLCPYDGAGVGGSGGAGNGGAGVGGSGGAGNGGGGAGGAPAGGGLTVTELTLGRRVVTAGQALEAEVSFGNTSGAPITLREIRIAARAPGASHAGGPYTDLAPVLTMATIPAGGHVTLSASRDFGASDTLGRWEAYATYQDAVGWHDEPSEYFFVRSGGGNGGSGGSGGDKPAGLRVGTQAWFIAPWAGTNYFKSGVNWATAYSSGDDIWNPELMAELAGFDVWRHMDSNAVNWSKIEHWSQRKVPTDPGNAEIYIDGSSPASTTGLAVEWQIDLCNRAHIDCWFTHPYLADDSYVRSQAELIKAKLDPSRLVYIELSNEVWNGAFSAFDQAIQAGQREGLPGSNQYYVGISHELKRALEIFEIYSDVFGASAMGARVIRVFSESGNLDLTTQALRDVYESSEWNPHGQAIDMIAMAPYIGNGQNGASESLNRWKSEVDSKVNGDIEYAFDNHVSAYDVPIFGCYESGMHHIENAKDWAENPDVYDAYLYMWSRFGERMHGPCVTYTLDGTWENASGKGAWGLYDHVGQAIAQAPKARAAKDWIAGVGTTQTSTGHVRLIVIVLLVLLFVFGLLWLFRKRTG